MYSYCPQISQSKCGFPDGTDSKQMIIKANNQKSAVAATKMRYFP